MEYMQKCKKSQVIYNKTLQDEEFTGPSYAHLRAARKSWQNKRDPIGMKPSHTESDKVWMKQMCIRMKAKCLAKVEAKTKAICEAFRDRFIAEYGQSEWDNYLEPPTATLSGTS